MPKPHLEGARPGADAERLDVAAVHRVEEARRQSEA